MKTLYVILGIIIVAGMIWAGAFYWQNLRGIWPAIGRPSEDITHIIEVGGAPLTLPKNFSISIFAEGLPGARVMRFDPFGNMWISQTNQGTVSLLEMEDGNVRAAYPIFRDLKKPHGLLFGAGEQQFALYIAEEDKIIRAHTYSEGPPEKIIDLPDSGGGHFTRTLEWLPGEENKKMLVSIGSSCNVCYEDDLRRATIMLLDLETRKLTPFASGLRNSVFMTVHPVIGEIWATEMGRDLLGDDIPPDEINIVEQSKDYGWPICYGKNIRDSDFDKNVYIKSPCEEPEKIPSYIDIPAHSAPLGLAFVPEEGWPEDYWYNLLVSYHGSWNRSIPTGYKVVRYKLDAQGKLLSVEDFITGWLVEPKRASPTDGVVINVGDALGRPVDILIQPGGVMYISDDKAGVIYRVVYDRRDDNDDNDNDNDDKRNLIRVSSPKPNEIIKSPFTVSGEARGFWFFEASFPIRLFDENGQELAIAVAQAQGDPAGGGVNWMTENFVPFKAILTFERPTTETGVLVLEKDNPSGLPEYADELKIPIRFR